MTTGLSPTRLSATAVAAPAVAPRAPAATTAPSAPPSARGWAPKPVVRTAPAAAVAAPAPVELGSVEEALLKIKAAKAAGKNSVQLRVVWGPSPSFTQHLFSKTTTPEKVALSDDDKAFVAGLRKAGFEPNLKADEMTGFMEPHWTINVPLK